MVYLQDETYIAEFPNGRQLKIFGSPWTPQCGNWAFQFPPIRDVFHGIIPPDTDILLTHGPPKLHLDTEPARRYSARGCEHLLKEIWRVRSSLKLVVFGHIHAGYGEKVVRFDRMQMNYDSIIIGISGLLSLIVMALSLLWSSSKHLFGLQENDDGSAVQLANAAIAPGLDESGPRKPLVIQL